MHTDQEDRELLKRIASGNRDAMAELYRRYESGLFAFAMKRLSDSQTASDVVHEVMIAVWNGASGFQGRSRVKTWMFGIAHKKSVDQIRKNVRHSAEALDDHTPDATSASAHDLIAAAQDRHMLSRCLEKLSEMHRQVVHLAFFEDMAYAEIATIAGVPEATIRTRMFHAKKLLKKCLSRQVGAS